MYKNLLSNITYLNYLKFEKYMFSKINVHEYFETKIPYGFLKYNETANLESIEGKPTIKTLIITGVCILIQKISKLLSNKEYIGMNELSNKVIGNSYNIVILPDHEKWKGIATLKDFNSILHKEISNEK